jgi:uncharacterized protein
MTQRLHIGPNFSFPLDFVTQTQAILAKKRVGKSYTASVEAEELLKAGQQIVAIDPTGAWWGLKSSADGKHAGFPITVFGGEHADVPLEESAGETIAQALVEHRFSAILDLTLFRKGQIARFMPSFLETLYRLNREAMHLFVDEADAIAPQRPFGEEARMLGALEDVVRRGGIRGIGTTLITQRPAVLNKNVLTQCEILCALRIVHHKDIDAIHEWIEVHGDPDLAKKMIDSLPALPIGTAWFWAPGWGDIFECVKIRARETFDSGATPKAGETKRVAKVLASVDLEKLGQQIQATVQRAKENDPRTLRTKIAQLEKELAKPAVSVKHAPEDPERLKKAAERAAKAATAPLFQQLAAFQKLAKRTIEKFTEAAAGLNEIANANLDIPPDAVVTAQPGAPAGAGRRTPAPAPGVFNRQTRRLEPENGNGNGNGSLPVGERAILIAVAQFGEAERDQLTVLTGYKRSSRDAYVARLAAKGYLDISGRTLRPTQEGVNALGHDYEPLPTGSALWEFWQHKLPEGELKILGYLVNKSGKAVDRDELDEPTGYKRSSRDAYLSRLAARRLVEVPSAGMVQAAGALFD